MSPRFSFLGHCEDCGGFFRFKHSHSVGRGVNLALLGFELHTTIPHIHHHEENCWTFSQETCGGSQPNLCCKGKLLLAIKDFNHYIQKKSEIANVGAECKRKMIR